MPNNYQVIDAYGSVITIQSSVFGSEQRQIIGASVLGFVPVSVMGVVPVSVPSIVAVGTYGQGSVRGVTDNGLATLAVRNDTVASLVSADKTYVEFATDSAGRTVIKPFAPDESTFRFVTSLVSGSVTLIKASAIGLRNYVTDVVVANSGSVFTLLTIQDGSTSILGYVPVPTTGGAVMPGLSVPMRTATAQDLAFKVSPSVSILSITVNGYQAP